LTPGEISTVCNEVFLHLITQGLPKCLAKAQKQLIHIFFISGEVKGREGPMKRFEENIIIILNFKFFPKTFFEIFLGICEKKFRGTKGKILKTIVNNILF